VYHTGPRATLDAMAERGPNTFDDGHLGDASTSASSPSTRIAGRYEILGLLGAGGMGTVYRVRDDALDEIVALKLLKPELLATPAALERFRQEVKLARRVTHPNVVRTFDLGEHDGDWFLTMEYVEGRSLAWRIAVEPPSAAEALELLADVCSGVAAAHRAGVLHRDLKPDNVLIGSATAHGERGRVAITDFGIAVPRGASAGMAGTPAYMAPEQVEGREVDGRADIYALGAILYELLTGKRAWPGDDGLAVARARLSAKPPDPRDLVACSDAVADVCLRCLSTDARYRYGSVDELRTVLLAAMTSVRPVPRTVAAPTAPTPGAQTMAVLPFRASEADGWLATGLAEDIVDTLSASSGLRVRPFAAVQRVGGDDPIAVGKALGVDAVLCGTLRRESAGILLSARVIGVGDGFQLWGKRFRATDADLLVTADAIASEAAAALAQQLVPRARAAADGRVVDLYLRARHEFRLAFETGTFDAAERYAREGLAIAPDDASLLAVHAMILARRGFYSIDPADPSLALGIEAARRAIAADPRSAEAWLAYANLSLYRRDVAEAVNGLRIALGHAPGLAGAQAMLGGILVDLGRLDEGIARLESSLSLDPIPMFVRADLARALAYRGQWDRVAAILPATSDQLATFIAAEYRARFALWSKDAPPALIPDMILFARLLGSMHPALPVIVALTEAADCGAIGDAVDAAAGAALYKAHGRLRAAIGQFLAEARAATGRGGGALEAIGLAIDAGLHDIQWMDHCAALRSVRTDERFATLRAVVAARAQSAIDALDRPVG
jgi:TolB-like protein